MQKNFLNLLIVSNLLLLFFSCSDGPKQAENNEEETYLYTNKLINETSPYLLDHAHNPVDWQPWSEEAFEEAKTNDKLVIISIGYSSCHWCHVMEEETFENEEVASIMNEKFVNIKVDREERPDIDEVYMTAINLIKGNGGWPLNVIALPDGKPIYTGTYHTTKQWNEVLTKVSKSYKEDPKRAQEYANMIAEGIQQSNIITLDEEPGDLEGKLLNKYVDTWSENWDLQWGGDKGQQKFMLPSSYSFLLDYALIQNDGKVMEHLRNSINNIARRGVYDHVGGGFFRYSTDSEWAIPHYEKMLYDNAQLMSLYSKAYRAFNDDEYKEVVKGIIQFLNSSMKNPEGGYYAAMDADSEGEEGKYYTWSSAELKKILASDFKHFSNYYSVFPEDSQGKRNVIFKTGSDRDFLENKGENLTPSDLNTKKQKWKDILIENRNKRTTPAVDDKIIVSWNALLISGFVEAYRAFGEEEYLDMAESTFSFIKDKGFNDGDLIHSYKEGGRKVNGFLDDYAYLISASIDLYSVTHDPEYLDFSEEMLRKVELKFSSENSVQYRYSENEDLISPILKIDDGVLPSPNSVMAENLFLLGHIYYNEEWLKKSESMLTGVQSAVSESPAAYAKWNHLYLKHAYSFLEIAITGENTHELYTNLVKSYYPNSIIVGSKVESKIPLFEERFIAGESYIYVCENRSCKRPVTTAEAANNLIEEIRRP